MGYSNAKILANAKNLKGTYVLGASGPNQWDCSSFVYCAIEGLSQGRDFTTGGEEQWLLNRGFKNVTDLVNLNTGKGMIPGDVLLLKHTPPSKSWGHTAIYYGDGLTIEANSSKHPEVPYKTSVSRSGSTDKWNWCFRAGAVSLEYWPSHGKKIAE